MSETPRIYSNQGHGFSFARRQRSQRARRWVVAAFGVALVYAFWISRDTHSISEFIPTDQRLELVVPRANLARHRFVESRVWEGVPASWAGGWPDALADTRGLPDWVVGNLVGSGAVAVANDLAEWDDFVVAAKMTRVGCLIERAMRVSPRNSSEWAGGLWLRRWETGGVYYAVRGRSLLVSPSRDTLVSALTLTPERRVDPEAVRDALAASGAEDARGTLTFAEDGAYGRAMSEVRFAVRIEDGEAMVKMRAAFRPDVSRDLLAYWGDTKPVTLGAPFEGAVTLTADLGTNVEESWRAFSEVIDAPWLTPEQWEAWRAEDGGRSTAAVLAELLGPMGSQVRVAWQGTDLLDMAPTPILVGSIAGSRRTAESVLGALPDAGHARTADAQVYFDRESSRVGAPLMSGPSMTPLGQWDGDTLYFSTSSATGDAFFAEGRAKALTAPRPGNAYLRIDPAAAMQQIVAVAEDLAASGMLRGYTRETIARDGAEWQERAAAIASFEVLASVNHERVEAEWYLKCTPRAGK